MSLPSRVRPRGAGDDDCSGGVGFKRPKCDEKPAALGADRPPGGVVQAGKSHIPVSRAIDTSAGGTGAATRRFPHVRGNWPTHVYVKVPWDVDEVDEIVSRLSASLTTLLRPGRAVLPTPREPVPPDYSVHLLARSHDLPNPSTLRSTVPLRLHVSLSRTVVLRLHEIAPFIARLRAGVAGVRKFTAAVVASFSVLLNEDGSRAFLAADVNGPAASFAGLITAVDDALEAFGQPPFYEDGRTHSSVVSWSVPASTPASETAPGPGSGASTVAALQAEVASRVGAPPAAGGAEELQPGALKSLATELGRAMDDALVESRFTVAQVFCSCGDRTYAVPCMSVMQ